MSRSLMKTALYRSSDHEQRIQSVYDLILAGWITPNEQFSVSTRHGRTFVIAAGPSDAPPVILLHGSGSSSYMWAEDVRQFSSQRRVFTVDIPGEAGKSEAVRASWDSEEFVEWMEDLYEGLGLKRAAVVGISLGGWIATKWAVSCPDKVERLVLLCPSGFAPARASFLPKIIVLSLLGDLGMRRIEDMLFGDVRRTPEVSDYFRSMAKGFIPRQGVPPLFTDEEISRLGMPLTLMVGDRDVLIDAPRTIARVRALLPQACTQSLKGVGHAVTGVSEQIVRALS